MAGFRAWIKTNWLATGALLVSIVTPIVQHNWDQSRDHRAENTNRDQQDRDALNRKIADTSGNITAAMNKISELQGRLDSLMTLLPLIIQKTGSASIRIPEKQVEGFKELFPDDKFKVELTTSEKAGHTLFTFHGEAGVDMMITPKGIRAPAGVPPQYK